MKKRRGEHDDDEALFDRPLKGEVFDRVTDGEQEFVIVNMKRIPRKERTDVLFLCRIVTQGPDFDAHIPYYGHLRIDGSMAPGSDLAGVRELIAGKLGCRAKSVTLRQFQDFWFKGIAYTCLLTWNKEPRPTSSQYSKVKAITEIIGKVGELPPKDQRT